MERRKNFKLKSWALAFLLPALFVSCTKSGALTGGTASASVSGTLTGSVNGGLSPVAGATVTLSNLTGITPTVLGSASTNSAGAFTISYTNPGSGILYVSVNGGSAGGAAANGKAQFAAMVGSGSSVPASVIVNELTTAAFMNSMEQYGVATDSNGAVNFGLIIPSTLGAFNTLNSGMQSDALSQYNSFITNGGINSSLSATDQTRLFAMANAIASCVENSGNCATLFSTAQSSSSTAAANILESLWNLLNVSSDGVSVYPIAVSSAASTGYSIPGGIGNLSFVVTPSIALTNVNNLYAFTFSGDLGSGFFGVAIDASGNAWATASNTSGDVEKLSPSGNLLGTYTTGVTYPFNLAIDASGNVWVSAAGNVVELSSSGSILGTFPLTGNLRGPKIDSAGNVWAVSSGGVVYKLNSSGTLLNTFSGYNNFSGLAIDSSGNVWLGNTTNLIEISSSGTLLNTVSTGGSVVAFPNIDSGGNVWVTNNGSATVTKVSSSGNVLGSFSVGSGPGGIAIDALQNVWIATTNQVVELNAAGQNPLFITSAGTPSVRGIAIDSLGDVWTGVTHAGSFSELIGATKGPEFFPYSGPQFP